MLVLKNICKNFKANRVLKNLNVEFKSGLNFIVGPSGSGKSTLLKIISGLDKEYDGEVIFNGKNIKAFKERERNSYYYNTVGFIYQDFQLIDHLTVYDNIRVVLELSNLSESEKEKNIRGILKSLEILQLKDKLVSKLSGGQKQRVAIGRALIKNPDIIIADEPTGALDKKSSGIIMEVLRKIAKERLVLVVTHDKSLIDENSNLFEMKNGSIVEISTHSKELIKRYEKKIVKPNLSIGNAFYLGRKNLRGLFLKFGMTALILMLSSYFLILNISGTVVNEQKNILDNLIETKGDMLRDISVYSSVLGASGTSNNENRGPSLDVKQDVSESLKKYMDDPRIEHFIAIQSIGDMDVSVEGIVDSHKVENSNGAPYVKKVIEGRLPKASGREVAVTKAFLERANLNSKDILGKKLNIKGQSYDWSTGNPVQVENKIQGLTVVGITDSTVSQKDPKYGEFTYEIEDSFIYGLDVVQEIRAASKDNKENISFNIRVKDIKDVMPIVEELSKKGITPMGEFESVSDILTINNKTKEQSGAITVIIGILSVVITIVLVLINTILRKREISILKVNGYSNKSLLNLSLVEHLLVSAMSIGLFLVFWPVMNKISYKIFNMSLSGGKTLLIGLAVIIIQGIIMGIIAGVIERSLKAKDNIMKGDR